MTLKSMLAKVTSLRFSHIVRHTKQNSVFGDATGERNRQQTSPIVVLLIVFIDKCMKRTSFLLWDRILPSYREHFYDVNVAFDSLFLAHSSL